MSNADYTSVDFRIKNGKVFVLATVVTKEGKHFRVESKLPKNGNDVVLDVLDDFNGSDEERLTAIVEAEKTIKNNLDSIVELLSKFACESQQQLQSLLAKKKACENK